MNSNETHHNPTSEGNAVDRRTIIKIATTGGVLFAKMWADIEGLEVQLNVLKSSKISPHDYIAKNNKILNSLEHLYEKNFITREQQEKIVMVIKKYNLK